MTRRYRITLVGSEEANGSRTVTTREISENSDYIGDIPFAVAPETLRPYTPNAGDVLVQDEDGGISFERVGDMRSLFRKQDSTGIFIQEHGPFKDQAEADRRAGELALDTGIVYTVGICTSEDGRTVVQ